VNNRPKKGARSCQTLILTYKGERCNRKGKDNNEKTEKETFTGGGVTVKGKISITVGERFEKVFVQEIRHLRQKKIEEIKGHL